MSLRACLILSTLSLLAGSLAHGQAPSVSLGVDVDHGKWQSPLRSLSKSSPLTLVSANDEAQPTVQLKSPPETTAAPSNTTSVSSGSGVLPNEHGQVWREYDIRPYTSRAAKTPSPEQAVVDWILRETGTEIWFFQPLGILSADANLLRVYHTPEIQRVVARIVDRFLSDKSESHVFGMRLITIDNPNWRTKAYSILKPVSVQTPGLEAWLLAKEDSAVLLSNLRKRSDYEEHNTPNVMIYNGQPFSLARHRPTNYVRSVSPTSTWPGYQLETAQIASGFSLKFSPLLSLDGTTIDAVIKANVNQVEKMEPVPIETPTSLPTRQRLQIQVPQIVSWQMHERFRWPIDQVLLLSCGVIAAPAPTKTSFISFGRNGSKSLRVNNPIKMGPARTNVLLFVESKGRTNKTLSAVGGASRTANRLDGRRY